MNVTVLIPAKNEAPTITELLTRVWRALAGHTAQVIVIDDGSSDDTAALAERVPGTEILRLRPGRGKGAALAEGLRVARGSVVIVQDADLEYDPADYPALLAPFADPAVQVVYGSRVLGARLGRQTGISARRFYWGGRFLSWLTTLIYGVRMTDISTGYKVFRTDVLRRLDLRATGFEFCPEATAALLTRQIPIREVPIAYSPRSVAQGKKIRWTDGLIAIWTLLRLRWWHRPGAQDRPSR